MASPSDKKSQSRIRPSGSARSSRSKGKKGSPRKSTHDTAADGGNGRKHHEDIEDILPFLRDAKERRKMSSLAGGSIQDDHHEDHSWSSSGGGGVKVDPTRIPKIGGLVFFLFILASQLHARIFNSASLPADVVTMTGRTSINMQENNGGDAGATAVVDYDLGGTSDEQGADNFLQNDELSSSDNSTATAPSSSLRGNHDKPDMSFVLPKVEAFPPELDHYARVTEPVLEGDIPVLFHIPRTGGSTLKEITAECLGLVQASEVGNGVDPAAASAEQLMVLTDAKHGGQYLNVDTTWLGGLERAKSLNLAQSGLTDILITPYYFQAGSLFDPEHRGRAFTMMRHPIHRAVSMYYYMNELALNGDEDMKVTLNGMNLEQYAKSDLVENNWVTRFLTNTLGGALTPADEALAREILAQKFVIGLLSDRQQSLERFIQYFNWPVEGEKAEDCIDRKMGWNWANKGRVYPKIKEDSKTWEILEEANTFDMRLYQYAEELFRMQAVLFTKT